MQQHSSNSQKCFKEKNSEKKIPIFLGYFVFCFFLFRKKNQSRRMEKCKIMKNFVGRGGIVAAFDCLGFLF